MKIQSINDATSAAEITAAARSLRGCVFYREERCCAPRIRFKMCRNCYRIDPRLAVKSLFEAIRALGSKLISHQGSRPEPLLPRS